MYQKHFKISLLLITAVILTLGLSISFQSLLAAWIAPLANPATCNTGDPGCDEPLNVGPLLQSKLGALWINTNGISPLGLIVEKGNVGIGTTNPANQLSVVSDGSYSEIGDYSYNSVFPGYGPSFKGYRARGSVSSPAVVQNNDGLMSLNGYGYSVAAGLFPFFPAAMIYIAADGEWDTAGDTTDTPGRISFFTSPDGTNTIVERMRIDNQGNVGIGITTPSAKLTIGGTAGVDGIKFPDGTLQTTAYIGGATDIKQSNGCTWYSGGCVRGAYASPGTSSISCPDGSYVASIKTTLCSSGGNSTDNSDWEEIKTEAYCCYFIPTELLYQGIHTPSNCISLGGTVMNDGANSYCRLSISSCPSGWSNYYNYSATVVRTCTGTTNNATNCPAQSCTTASHAWANIAKETCIYNNRTYSWGSCHDTAQTCSATINQLGCY
jgi:hypothetical protein